ncbi:MAG TPA: hypothetical protein DCQ31_19485 [Bacteroidales bacterium]|nr:hypothetical protein [Bacteroidales bacterium]
MTDLRKSEVIDALKLFDKKANELITLLAEEFALDLNQQNPFIKLLWRQNKLWCGNLKNDWSYSFHGDSCEFINKVTNQFLDIKINRNGNYGVIDNFYLYRFIETTESLNHVFKKIESKDDFYKILDELETEHVIIDLDEFKRSRVLNIKMIDSQQ